MAEGLVAGMLAEYATAVRGPLFAYLADGEPRGRLHELMLEYPRRGGRAFRPGLCVATARAFGATTEDAVCSAAAIELLHNAMLVHDDIEDESLERRGRPALHVSHGVALALNAGDALALRSLRPLLDNRARLGARLALKILEETERTAQETAEGQALELGWRRDNIVDVDERDYLEMVLKKTAWLTTIHPMRVGACIGSRGAADLEPFIRFGFLLGAAFQIQDDVLNLIGDAAAYGKELDGDIREGKRTLMLIHLLAHADADERARIVALLGRPRGLWQTDEVRWVRARMDVHGSIDAARQSASALAGAAQHECERAFAGVRPSRDRDFVAALPTWVIERS
jgi:geranylgeranyl diphosphate synthase type II